MNLDIPTAREQMISQQLRTWNVLDEGVLNAVRNVAREHFVPDAYRQLAFADAEVPLAHGQVMLAPKLEARILQTMAIKASDLVLLVGAGSGHLAACAAQLADKVRVTEVHSDLAEQARRNLQGMNCNNVYVDNVDALQLELNQAYDVVIVTGALPTPEPRLERALKIGGRLFVVIGTAPVMQAMKITRSSEQQWQREYLFETELPALPNTRAPSTFVF
jgi:protein-L-isoaspartate(D-aspartate) O-methyltransferase